MKIISGFIGVLIKLSILFVMVGVLVHGYFFINYGTADPCAAAAKHLSLTNIKAQRASVYGARGYVTDKLRTKGVLTCYEVAFLGANNKEVDEIL